MQPDIATDRLRPIQIEDEAAVRQLRLLAKLRSLPGLALIFAEVLDDEEPDIGN
jgi:hypothetical protein